MKNIILFLSLFLLSATVAHSESIGMVVAVQGSVSASDASGASRDLAVKSDVFLNDTVKTGPASRLQIMLNDDSLLAQGENSEMTIDEYVYNPAQASDNAFGARLGKGLFRTVTGKITDLNPDRFSVKTSRATIGIRGCDLGFHITDSQDNIAIMAIPDSKQIFINPLTGGQSLMVQTPAFVTVDDRGNVNRRDLTGQDRSNAQQGTTPGAGTPPPDLSQSGTEPASLLGGSTVTGGETGSGDTGNIIQNTAQPTDSHMIP